MIVLQSSIINGLQRVQKCSHKNISSFLEKYKPVYDLVFMDIRMPMMDGMQAAKKLREADTSVLLVFVTRMGDYAIQGYDVGATAFIKKPISYFDFEMKMKRIIFNIRQRDSQVITIVSGTAVHRLHVRDLMYIEVSGHRCTYHTCDHLVEARNSLSRLSEELAPYHFMMCNSCYLVNPHYIRSIKGHTVTVGPDELTISQPKKKAFMLQFNEWISRGGA